MHKAVGPFYYQHDMLELKPIVAFPNTPQLDIIYIFGKFINVKHPWIKPFTTQTQNIAYFTTLDHNNFSHW